MKSYNAHGLAGCVSQRRNRQTGTLIGVYNGEQAGIDTDDGTAPWSTVCEEHSTVSAHATLRLAQLFAPSPADWCEDCAATHYDDES